MQVEIKSSGKSGRSYGSLELPKGATVLDLKKAFEQKTKISIYQQSFKYAPTPEHLKRLEDDSKTLEFYGVQDRSELLFRNLGRQIGYRFVFVMEYLGPLLFVLFYASRPAFIYGEKAAEKPFAPTAKLGIICWCIHFLKREFETFFVHRFSRPTMPFFNLIKNCSYYWSFGAVIGYPLCHPDYQGPSSETQIYIGLAIFAISEILNFCVHLQFRFLRPAEGSKERPIPSGPLFALVSCPNYTFEVLGWVGFSIFSQILFAYVFAVIGFLQMSDWALKKHRNYIKSYGDKYKRLGRKAIVPFIL